VPLLSAFTPIGLLELSGETSDAENLYATIKAQMSPAFNISDSTYEGCEAYALAMQLAWARAILKRVPRELHPATTHDLLTTMERDWSCTPIATDTLYQRQLRLVARKLLMRGSREEAIVTDLIAALGADFLKLNAIPSTDAANYPTTATDVGTFPAPSTAPKFFKMTTSVPWLGVPYSVVIESINASAAPLVGEKLTFEPDITGNAEAVTLTAVTPSIVSGIASSPYTVTATFTKAHSVGGWAITGAPLWLSNRYHLQVVLTATAATNATKRALANGVMQRHARSCERWSIAAATSSTQVGPHTCGVTITGATPTGAAANF